MSEPKICPIMSPEGSHFDNDREADNHKICIREHCQWWWKCREPIAEKRMSAEEARAILTEEHQLRDETLGEWLDRVLERLGFQREKEDKT